MEDEGWNLAATPPDHLKSARVPRRPVVLAGPTAVGKSEVALRLAETLNGEIVCVDSMQVYRGMDIGTAKASAAERAHVPHHLVDVVDVSETFDAAQFVRLARHAVSEIQGRGRVPILCGGTGLYFKAFFEGLGNAPPGDAKVRAELGAVPLVELLRELAERDPTTYVRIDRQNPRRVIRAVEVIRLTGKPFSQQRSEWSHASPFLRSSTAEGGRIPHSTSSLIGLLRNSNDLQHRIDTRVESMFRAGLVAETETLLAGGLAQNLTASQALGYRQVAEYLRGQRSLPETIELVKIRTRQFAKRQMTWFRRQLVLNWFRIEPVETVADIVQRLARELTGSARGL